MNKKELKEAMTSIFEGLMESSKKEAEEEQLYKFIKKQKEWLGDPEDMYLMISNKIKHIINSLVKKTLNTNNRVVCMIYTEWAFFENSITELCTKLYGSACSADRGRFVLTQYIKYKVSGKLPEWDGDHYWIPKTGTPVSWFNLVEGLANLYHGRTEKYLQTFLELSIGSHT